MTIVAEDLHLIGPFNLNNSPPDRKGLESILGKGLPHHKGQGGEKLFALCYSLAGTSKVANKLQSILFIFNSDENKSLLSGYSLEKKNSKCPKILSAKAHIKIIESPVFNLVHLNTDSLRASLSVTPDSVNENPAFKLIIKEFESKKIVNSSDKNYSEEVAINLKSNNSKGYVVDTITSLRAEFNNEYLEVLSIIYRETY